MYALLISILMVGSLFADEAPALRRVRQMLARQEVLRIFVDWAPRMGHQAAGAHLLRRLRELGHSGQIEVVYRLPAFQVDEMRNKMAILFPGFDREGDDVQDVPSLDLRYVPFGHFESSHPKRIDLAMTAAADFIPTSADLASNMLVVTQPLGWEKPWGIEVADGRRQYVVGLTHLKQYGHRYDLSTTPPALAKSNSLGHLHRQRDRVETSLYYGHGLFEFRTEQLAKYLFALEQASEEDPASFAKPIVVLIVHEGAIDLHDLQRMIASQPRLFRRMRAIAVDHARFQDAVDQLDPGRILVVLSPLVQPELFHHRLAHASVVPVAGGRNSMNVLGQIGRPYLPSNEHESFHFLETRDLPASFRATDAWVATSNARQAFLENDCTRDKVDCLAKFIREAKDPTSSVSELFRAAKLPEDPESDLVVRVLLEAREHVRRPMRRRPRNCGADLEMNPSGT